MGWAELKENTGWEEEKFPYWAMPVRAQLQAGETELSYWGTQTFWPPAGYGCEVWGMNPKLDTQQ